MLNDLKEDGYIAFGSGRAVVSLLKGEGFLNYLSS